MDELKELFGDGALSYEDFESKVAEKGFKLANIKAGGYVDKGKYEKLSAEFQKFKDENDISKYSDYDALKQEVETLRAEKEASANIQAAAKAGVLEQFRKFVVAEVKPLVTKDKDFAACLAEYLKDNEQYLEKKSSNGGFFDSTVPLGKNSGSQKTPSANKTINDFVRNRI